MPSITPMMSAIFLDDALISSIVETTCDTTAPPRAATSAAEDASWFAWLAASADWRTVPVSCSIDEAVSCRLDAASSVRVDRSWLPVAISLLAVPMLSVELRTWPTRVRRLEVMVPSERIRRAISSPPSATT